MRSPDCRRGPARNRITTTLPRRRETGQTQPSGVLRWCRLGSVHDHTERQFSSAVEPRLDSRRQPQQHAATLDGGIDFQVAEVQDDAPLATRKQERSEGGAENPQDFLFPLRDEATGLAHGAKEPDVVVAVADSKRPPGTQRVGELPLETFERARQLRRCHGLQRMYVHRRRPR